MADSDRSARDSGTPDVMACEGCALVGRRDFLRDATLMATAALVALGASPERAAAARVDLVTALGGGREDKAYPIPAADGVQIDKANSAVVMRWMRKVYVFALACPHQNTALRWHDKDAQFECPKHHSRFSPDGLYVKDSGRATRGLDRMDVRKDGNNVVANLDKVFQEDDDHEAWTSAFIVV